MDMKAGKGKIPRGGGVGTVPDGRGVTGVVGTEPKCPRGFWSQIPKGDPLPTPWRETLMGLHGEEQLEVQNPREGGFGAGWYGQHTAENLWCEMRDLALSTLAPGWDLGCVCRDLG